MNCVFSRGVQRQSVISSFFRNMMKSLSIINVISKKQRRRRMLLCTIAMTEKQVINFVIFILKSIIYSLQLFLGSDSETKVFEGIYFNANEVLSDLVVIRALSEEVLISIPSRTNLRNCLWSACSGLVLIVQRITQSETRS